MKPFNEATPCPKCGAADAMTEYQNLSNVCAMPVLAKMIRTCRHCAYNWYELPLDAPDLGAYFESKPKHIESRDSNAICLCGADLVYRGSGLFVCPNGRTEEPEGQALLLGSYVKESLKEGPKLETTCGCRWLVDRTKDMRKDGYPKEEVFARQADFLCRKHGPKGGAA